MKLTDFDISMLQSASIAQLKLWEQSFYYNLDLKKLRFEQIAAWEKLLEKLGALATSDD